MRANPFRFFPAGVTTKKVTLQNITQRLHLTYLRGIPTQPNLTKIGIRVGVSDIINHTKFGNDRSREYKVLYGGSNFGLLHRNGLSPITL